MMKQDLDLIREILLLLEKHDDGTGHSIEASNFDDFRNLAKANILYGHLKILKERGFLEENSSYGSGGYFQISINRLTAIGHDYLESVRDPKIWRETKEGLAKVGGSTTLALVQALAVSVAHKVLGL